MCRGCCVSCSTVSVVGVDVTATRSKRIVAEVIEMAVDAALDVFVVGICTQDKVLADIKIKGTLYISTSS